VIRVVAAVGIAVLAFAVGLSLSGNHRQASPAVNTTTTSSLFAKLPVCKRLRVPMMPMKAVVCGPWLN
jgi:hypothetical protein